MKYLLTQISILIVTVILLSYFFSLNYFLPTVDGNINWYNVLTVLFLIFFLTQSVFSTIFFLFEKFLTCGIKEFPNHNRSLKWGIGIGFCCIFSLLVGMFNIFPLFYAFAISVIILVILNIFNIF